MNSKTNKKVALVGEQSMKDFQRVPLYSSNTSYSIKVKDETYNCIKLKVLEFHENSIVTRGFTFKDGYTPKYVLFNERRKDRKIKVIDSMVTTETAILYLDEDPRKYCHSKRCKLFLYSYLYFPPELVDLNKLTSKIVWDPIEPFIISP